MTGARHPFLLGMLGLCVLGLILPALAEEAPEGTPIRLDFLYTFTNEPSQPYYPLEGLAGCVYSTEGTLIICDEKKGAVYGLDASQRRWFEFDRPPSRPYRPVDVQIDGFKVLVLDSGSEAIHRFDLSGAYLDQVVDVRQLDPAVISRGTAFAMDRDGRMVITDTDQQQVMLLDAFLELHMRLGEPGTQEDQFIDPGGLAFLPDGGFLAVDRGNRRLVHYGRLGFFEATLDGDLEKGPAFVMPANVAVDRKGNVFVTDPGNGLIHVLDYNFRHRFSAGQDFGAAGSLVNPQDLAVGPGDLLAVTDRDREVILVYRIIYN